MEDPSLEASSAGLKIRRESTSEQVLSPDHRPARGCHLWGLPSESTPSAELKYTQTHESDKQCLNDFLQSFLLNYIKINQEISARPR